MTVIHPINKAETYDVDALVDTGADVTLINKEVVENLHLVPNGFQKMGDFQGNIVGEKPTYLVGISFGTFTYSVVATETNGVPILGRDILNKITTLLKGPTKQMEMS